MIFIIGIFISFFLALLILTKKGRELADIVLGIWMFVLGLHLIVFYCFLTGNIYEYSFLMGINFLFPFLHGPFLYIYTLALTKPERFKSRKWLINFILPLLILFSVIPFISLPAEKKEYIFKHNGIGYENYMWIINIMLSISGIVYIFITNLLLINHRKKILDQFSNQERINLNWLRFLFYGMGVIWFQIILIGNDNWIFISATLFVILIGYFGIKQVGIFTNPKILEITGEEYIPLDSEDESISIEKKKYAKSGLNEETANNLHNELNSLIEKEKLFLDPELTLVELASKLDIHPNYLSQVINEKEQVNFYDYINSLRILEFKRLVAIPENQKFTLLGLAFDSGFNSKSAFNRFFKKLEGISPSEYLKSINS